MNTLRKGFTLIEILVVIGIIAVLVAIVLIAVNPARQFAQARNAQRRNDVSAILNAVGQNIADNKGNFTCSGAVSVIPSAEATMKSGGGTGTYDIAPCLVPDYLAAMPFDPQTGAYVSVSNYDAAYTIVASSTGRITIKATAELGQSIELTR